jgi:hypothetical protein
MAGSPDSDVSAEHAGPPRSELRALTTEEAGVLDRTRRGDRTDTILIDADRRDEDATARDVVSDERERVADREAFTDPSADYLGGHRARRDAALDRADARSDRESSAADRVELAEGPDR